MPSAFFSRRGTDFDRPSLERTGRRHFLDANADPLVDRNRGEVNLQSLQLSNIKSDRAASFAFLGLPFQRGEQFGGERFHRDLLFGRLAVDRLGDNSLSGFRGRRFFKSINPTSC